MKTSKLSFFLALAFFFCANLHAQVTIGGLTEPKPGTILDLNSTVKGGLILSNVSLTNLSEIPSSFPDIAGIDAAILKANLKGSLIYNTNTNLCTGIHVWNGNFWERIASGIPVPAQEPLSITSGSSDPLLGDKIEFTAPSGANIYRWYASMDDAPYEYIGFTTTNTFSKTFPVGDNHVKVVMDDCRSLKVSNEVTFAEVLSPSSGSTAGGNIIYIYGDFPYAATSEYISTGLIAMWDGIDNTGQGDKLHSNTATTWKDLTGHGYDGTLNGGAAWNSNSLVFDGIDDYVFLPDALDIHLPATAEGVTKTTTDYNGIMYYDKNEYITFGYFKTRARFIAGGGQPPGQPTYDISGSFNNAVTTLSMRYGTNFPYEIQFNMNGVIVPPDNNTYDYWSAGEKHSYIGRRAAILGGNPAYYYTGNIFSIRIYDHQLSDDSLAHNAALDQKRYLAPPTVTIGGQACTEVVVLSPHFLMCKAPSSASTGLKDVVVNNSIIYPEAYRYVSTSEFYISSISPIVGTAGTPLTLEGNDLGLISKVEVGGKECTSPNVTTNYTCILPDNPPGEVDIIITLTDGRIYRFAKVFEYKN